MLEKIAINRFGVICRLCNQTCDRHSIAQIMKLQPQFFDGICGSKSGIYKILWEYNECILSTLT